MTDAVNALVLIGMRSSKSVDLQHRAAMNHLREIDAGRPIELSPDVLRKLKLEQYRRELRKCIPCSQLQLPIYVDPLEQGCGLRHLSPEERAACRDIEVRIWNGRLERVEQEVRGLVRATRPRAPSFWERIKAWWHSKAKETKT